MAVTVDERLHHPMLQEFYEFWAGRRRGRAMPSRADIDPCEIRPSFLPNILLVELCDLAARRFRYRLAGTAIVQAFGIEMTGTLVGEITTGAYRETLLGLYETAFEAGRPVLARSSFYGIDHAPKSIARLLLPLSVADRPGARQVISLHVFDYGAGRAERIVGHAISPADTIIEVL
jgi:hypothetical protein